MSKLFVKHETLTEATGGYVNSYGRYSRNSLIKFPKLETIERYTAFCKSVNYSLNSDPQEYLLLISIGYGVDVTGVALNGGEWAVTYTGWIQFAGNELGYKKNIMPTNLLPTSVILDVTVAAYGVPTSSS